MDEDYRTVNQDGWDRLARAGCELSTPCGPGEFVRARALLDPHGWLPWRRLNSVLCLAAGGGRHGPLFAYLGYDVTVVDLSAEQLRRDREVADRYGLALACVQADMLDLSVLGGRCFDMVYQPVSTLYVPDVGRCYRQVARVLVPGGLYHSEHWNPVQMQLSEARPWDGEAYRIVHRPSRGVGLIWTADTHDGAATCQHYIHSIGDLIGSVCAAGFVVTGFAEQPFTNAAALPGSQEHLAGYLPSFFSILARRRQAPARSDAPVTGGREHPQKGLPPRQSAGALPR